MLQIFPFLFKLWSNYSGPLLNSGKIFRLHSLRKSKTNFSCWLACNAYFLNDSLGKNCGTRLA